MFSFWPIPNFFVYGLWPMKFWTFKENYFVSFVNTAFNVSRGSIGWNFFPTKNYNCSTISGLWMKNLLNSCRITLSQLSKKFLRVQATFSCYSFCENCANFFCPFVFWLIQLHFRLNFLRQGLQNCTLRARGSFRGKVVDFRFFWHFFNRVRIWAKIFRFCGKNCAAALSKVHFFRQRNKTEEFLFWKIVSFFNNFLTSGWIVPDTQWHFSKVSSKAKFLFPKKYFGLKFVFQA